MADLVTFVDGLILNGFTLSLRDGKLIVAPASGLSAGQRETIKANRDGILELVDLMEQDKWIVYLSDTGALDNKHVR